LAVLLCASYSYALIDLTIFGPKRYDRLKDAPTVYTDTFERCNPAQFAVLKIQNGDGKETRIKAASVYVNGIEVVKENEFKQLVPYIEKTVPVKDVNELKVVLKSGMQDDPNNKLLKEQSFLVIEVIGKGCDDTPPTISNPQPADGSLLNNGRPVISASYADNAGGTGIDSATASMKVDGTDVTSSSSVTALGISYTPASELPDGEHTAAVSVSDKAHNSSTLTWHFRTDTIAPSVKITSLINNQYLNTPTITLSGTVSDDPAGNPSSGGVTVTVNGHSAEVSGNTFALSNLSLSEGANTVTVEAKDLAGNVGSDTIVINLDTAPPVVSISSPNANSYLNAPQINVTGSVNESVTSLVINGVNVGAIGQSPVQFTANVTLQQGSGTINVEATDKAGNTGTASVSVYVDSMPPVVTLSAPAGAAAGSTISISAGATDPSGVTLIEVLANGITIWSSVQPSSLNPQPSISYTLSPDFPQGSVIDITARATDTTGLTGTATAKVTVNQGPTGPGYIQGEVYDDLRGLRLEGATASLLSTDGHRLTQIDTDDYRGGWRVLF
jgi:hypothetical protein